MAVNPRQMFDHELNPVKGWPSPYAVDASGAYASAWVYADTAGTTIHAGSVVTPTASGWIKGGKIDFIPVFVLQGNYEMDVISDTGATNGGTASGLPACACYELETTEFLLTADGGSYDVGTWLSSYLYTDTTNYGKVRQIAAFDKSDMAGVNVCNVVGYVTAPERTNEHGKKVLKFYTHFIPNTILPA